MGVTISTHNGSAVRRDHNIRNINVVSKEEHIRDKEHGGIHEIWADESERAAYHRLFDDALKEYNAKTRANRQIKNYYNHVKNKATQHTSYEMIIGIYGGECSKEQGKTIMHKFVDGWKERNPNLELIGAYYHDDEQGEPHVHIDYIPVAHGYVNGMQTQAGLVKAFGEQGFFKDKKRTAQIQWEARENSVLENLCNEQGLTVDHPKEAGRQHQDTEAYKSQQQVKELKEEVKTLRQQVGELKKLEELKTNIKKKYFGVISKKGITMSPEDYDGLVTAATSIDNIQQYKADLNKREAELKQKEEAFNKRYLNLNQTITEAEEARKEYTYLKTNQSKIIEKHKQQLDKRYDEALQKALDTVGNSTKYARARELMAGYSVGDTSLLNIFDQKEKAFKKSVNKYKSIE